MKDIHHDRRSGKDRRGENQPFLGRLLGTGNRTSVRRKSDSRKITILDYYQPTLLFSILAVLCLSLIDATLTLMLLERGAVEINPIMHYYITLGPIPFVLVKYALTALPLIIIVMLSSVISLRYRAGNLIIPFCGLIFGSVVIWELYLLNRLS